MNLLKLTEFEVESISPISYTVIFDNREHKQMWHIEFSGDQQAILSDLSRNPLMFITEHAAIEYFSARWSSLPMI